MIRAFKVNDRVFNNNGDVVITPFKARVKNEDNGNFVLDMTCSIKYADYIKENNIIIAPTPQGDQPFRIRDYKINNYKIEVTAYHVYYDAENYLIVDSYVAFKNGDAAIKYLNSNTTPASDFTVGSNVTSINNYRCVRKSLKEAIDLMLERWGGHLVRNAWNIQLKSSIGVDNGITVEYRKNIKEIEVEYDWSEVVTKILPVGNDEIMLPEQFINSSTQYAIPYCKSVEFSQEGIERDDFPSEADYIAAVRIELRRQATEYLKTHCKQSVNYTMKAEPEKVTDIGDYILVKDKEIGIDLITQVTAYEYDAYAEKFVSLEFGNYKKTVKSAIEYLIKKSR
jgi:phage minor structural protein